MKDQHESCKGNISELLLCAKILELGGMASKPVSNDSYDLIVDFNGRLNRLQIKSTSNRNSCRGKDWYHLNTYWGQGKKTFLYSGDCIDFVVGYVVPTKTWYIIPINDCRTKTVALYPHNNTNGKYEIFKERWDLLGATDIKRDNEHINHYK